MKILLKELVLKNFKGIKDKRIEFGEKTNILGANGTGKTTIRDAFTWLIFNKDSQGNAKFEIKTIVNGQTLHELEHEVRGTFEISDQEIELAKIYKEKWVKSRGQKEKVLSGHTTEYFINSVPVKKKEYDAKIADMFDVNLFDLLSNPTSFATMDWKKRREELFKLVEVDSPSFPKEIEEIIGGKTLDDLKKEKEYQRRKYVKDRDELPVKIQTLYDLIEDIDVDEINKEIDRLEVEKNQLQANLEALLKQGDERTTIENQIEKLKLNKAKRLNEIEALKPKDNNHEVLSEIRQIESEMDSNKFAITQTERKIELLSGELSKTETELNSLREKVIALKRKDFDQEVEEICPYCKRPYDLDKIEEHKEKTMKEFNISKAKSIKELTERGVGTKQIHKGIKVEINSLLDKKEELYKLVQSDTKKVEELQAQADKKMTEAKDKENEFEKNISNDEKLKLIDEEIDQLKYKLENVSISNEKAEVKANIGAKEKELTEAKNKLVAVSKNAEINEKIANTEKEEKELTNAIAKCEKILYLIESHVRKHATLVEKAVNEKFKYAKFRLFEENISNDGLTEVCRILKDGVEYDDLNTASKLNIGIDVINTLSSFYDYKVPVWIDNRESVTEVIENELQEINLIVDPSKKVIEIKGDK